jgi:hypothetical protein
LIKQKVQKTKNGSDVNNLGGGRQILKLQCFNNHKERGFFPVYDPEYINAWFNTV